MPQPRILATTTKDGDSYTSAPATEPHPASRAFYPALGFSSLPPSLLASHAPRAAMEMAKLSNEVESESERKRASTKLTSESTGKITSSCIPDRTQYFPNAKGFKKWRTSRKSSRCFLLELPSELRMCIWNYAIAGLRIALYQERGPDKERGRLTYGIVDKSSTRIPGRLVPVTYNAYHETIEKIHGIPQVYNRPPVLKQRRLTALLKTCRLM